MKSDSEIQAAQNQPPQQTPEQIRAQAQLAVAQTRANAQLSVAQIKGKNEEAYAASMAQTSHDDNVTTLQKMQLQRDLAILNYSQQHNLTLEQTKADLAKVAMQEETKRQLAAAEMQMRQNEGLKPNAETLQTPQGQA